MLFAAAAGGVVSSLLGGGTSSPSTSALTDIPAGYLTLYQQATGVCPGLDWSILAAIGKIESDHGRSQLPGVQNGENAVGAGGSMQFLESTFTAVIGRHPIPPGGATPPSRYNPHDAIYAAAFELCDNGARNGHDLRAAIFAYNHADWYVNDVLRQAAQYSQALPTSSAGCATIQTSVQSGNDDSSDAALIAVAYACAQIGRPYSWGGETPETGFDCSGLTQSAYQSAGIALPRVAQEQFNAGPHLPTGVPLNPGDLVFFGSGPADITHVGLFLGIQNGQPTMVDAPHREANVRLDPFSATIGAPWGSDIYLGATRPAGR